MHAWETLVHYTNFDRRWFEPSNRYLPGDEHLSLYRSAMPDTWRLWRRGLWFIADPPGVQMPMQGWKLHVSTTGEQSEDVLRLALPVLRETGTPFKFLLDVHAVNLTNGKTFPRTASGKFITVYPVDEATFRMVGAALAGALEGYSGPYILSDRRWPGSTSVYYRYGGFTGVGELRLDGSQSLMIKDPDGALVPDVRAPYWDPPAWVKDPFGPLVKDDDDDDGLLGGRFEVTSALGFGNRGGIYVANDIETGREVVLKEARPGVLVGNPGRPAIEVLVKEYELLQALADTGLFARPVAFFYEAEHAFLVEEKLDAVPYGQHSISTNPLYTLDLRPEALRTYYRRMRRLWRQMALAIGAAHERGILLGDLSHTNVLVDDAGERMHVIDLETSVREGIDPHLGIYTVGLSSPRLIETRRYDRANDWHALGGLILSSIMVVNNTTGFHRPALTRYLAGLAADLALPTPLTELIAALMDQDATWTVNEVVERIDALPFDESECWSEPVPLALPPTDANPTDDELGAVVGAVGDYIRATADPQREDRLFPADLTVYETNPLSVAFGAYGVLYGLQRIQGGVPAELKAWALAHDPRSATYPPGLYFGQAGMAWVLDEIAVPEVAVSLMERARAHPLRFAASNIVHGAAGYGLACLRLAKRLGDDRLMEDARAAGEALAATAVRDAGGARWPDPECLDPERRVRVGYAYGASGIATFLLYLHLATGEERWYELGRSALAHDLSQGVRYEDRIWAFPRFATDDPATTEVLRNYWDEGSAGVATAALRYLVARPDPELVELVPQLLVDSCRKYTVFPQLFHGLAGLGNVLLDAGELLGDERWFAEARRAAAGILYARVDRPEGIVFPGEQAMRETVDLATGSTGVALFLDRLRRARPGGRTSFNFLLDEFLP